MEKGYKKAENTKKKKNKPEYDLANGETPYRHESKTFASPLLKGDEKEKIKTIWAGGNVTAVVTDRGQIWIWGESLQGQLGVDGRPA